MNYLKIYSTILFLVGGTTINYAQDVVGDKVPGAVKSQFEKTYPEASDIDWKMSGANYEVSFDQGKTDHKATYSPSGKIVSFQEDINESLLPEPVAGAIKSKYPQGHIDDVTRINTAGKITYKIDIEGPQDVNVWYTAGGKLLKEMAD